MGISNNLNILFHRKKSQLDQKNIFGFSYIFNHDVINFVRVIINPFQCIVTKNKKFNVILQLSAVDLKYQDTIGFAIDWEISFLIFSFY